VGCDSRKGYSPGGGGRVLLPDLAWHCKTGQVPARPHLQRRSQGLVKKRIGQTTQPSTDCLKRRQTISSVHRSLWQVVITAMTRFAPKTNRTSTFRWVHGETVPAGRKEPADHGPLPDPKRSTRITDKASALHRDESHACDKPVYLQFVTTRSPSTFSTTNETLGM